MMTNLKYIAIIPARYASTRFPAKPLAFLGGKPIVQHVYERVVPYFDETIVATDHDEIFQCVEGFGGKAVMTSEHHKSGTDRCQEAYEKSIGSYDVVVNVQGDEPFIHASQLLSIKECFADAETQIATLVRPFDKDATWEVLQNPNSPKVVVDHHGFAMYFSRSVIPYVRGKGQENWLKGHTFYKHIGLYAYRSSVLQEITRLPQSSLELAESLEQLRWLENGYKIKVSQTNQETIGIDTPEDLRHAEEFYKRNKDEK